MIATRLTPKVLLALTCCLFIALVPLTVSAQGIIQKGAEGIKKGAETTVDKTKEGAEAVGKGVKKAVTGDDTYTNTERMKPSGTSTGATQSSGTTKKTMGTKSTTTKTMTGHNRLPRTAGELPFLALLGVLALGAAGASRLVRQEH